jgi:hypothetical protein
MKKTARSRLGKHSKAFPTLPTASTTESISQSSTLFCDKPNIEAHADSLGIPDESPHVDVLGPSAPSVPHTIVGIPINCSDTSATWRNIPHLFLSKKAVVNPPQDALPPVLDARKPIAAIVRMDDPSKPVSSLPPAIVSKLNSFHGQYAFQWDEGRLYGYVEMSEHDWDSGHPEVSGKDFNRSPAEPAASDMLFRSGDCGCWCAVLAAVDNRDARSCPLA